MIRAPRVPRPSRPVLLTILVTALLAFPMGIALASHQFSDVPNSNAFHADIDALVDAGVTAGCGSGKYCPKANVTREQMAAFMNRLGALAPGRIPVVNADKLDGLDASAFASSSVADDAWAYVISNGGLHASSGNLTVTKPDTGEYCVVVSKRQSHKAAQVTLADPGGNKIVSVGTGHGSACNPLFTETHDAVPVYVTTTAGAPIDANFTIVVPAP